MTVHTIKQVSQLSAKELLGVDIDPELFILSLTHKSFANENYVQGNYERLEFLGDAVLELVVTEYIYQKFPHYQESKLAKLRSSVVCEDTLAKVALSISLDKLVMLGKGERVNNGSLKPTILCDVIEAVFGAVFLSNGIKVAKEYILSLIKDVVDDYASNMQKVDAKGTLQELVARKNLGNVTYRYQTSGPIHQLVYEAEVFLQSATKTKKHIDPNAIVDQEMRCVGKGVGTSKKKASIEAAKDALNNLK